MYYSMSETVTWDWVCDIWCVLTGRERTSRPSWSWWRPGPRWPSRARWTSGPPRRGWRQGQCVPPLTVPPASVSAALPDIEPNIKKKKKRLAFFSPATAISGHSGWARHGKRWAPVINLHHHIHTPAICTADLSPASSLMHIHHHSQSSPGR